MHLPIGHGGTDRQSDRTFSLVSYVPCLLLGERQRARQAENIRTLKGHPSVSCGTDLIWRGTVLGLPRDRHGTACHQNKQEDVRPPGFAASPVGFRRLSHQGLVINHEEPQPAHLASTAPDTACCLFAPTLWLAPSSWASTVHDDHAWLCGTSRSS